MARLRGYWRRLGTQQSEAEANVQNDGSLRSPNSTGSPALGTGIVTDSPYPRDDEFSGPVKKVRTEEATEALKPCSATGMAVGSLNGVGAQFVHCFPTKKGKRSVRQNCQINQALKDVIGAKDYEVDGLSKSSEQFQNEHHAVLPTQQVKEPLSHTGVEGVASQTGIVVKRKRGRPKGSGVKRGSRGSKSQASGLSFQGKGSEAVTPVRNTPLLCPSGNFEEIVSASGGFLVEERFGGKEADVGVSARNWWSPQETEALLKIKSEMGPTVKGQLWEDVSRKLAQQGYTRSAQRCKEKFSNVQCYKRRLEEGRAGRQGVTNPPLITETKKFDSTTNASTTTLATTSTLNSASTSVSIGIGSSSDRCQGSPVDSVMPASGNQIPYLNGTSDEAAKSDMAIASKGGPELSRKTLEKHATISLCLEKINPCMQEENGGSVDEASNSDMTVSHSDNPHVLRGTSEIYQTPFLLPGKFNSNVVEETGDTRPISDEVIIQKDIGTSSRSLKHPQSSKQVESSLVTEARGDDRASQSSFDIRGKTNSFSMQWAGERLPPENASLPFKKTSDLWAILESKQAFQKTPQHPHFQPLEEKEEAFREGYALGYMVSFANLVEGILNANLEDPRSTFENNLKALSNLETHGFAVQLIQSRLEDLLRLKDRYCELDEELKTVVEEAEKEKQDHDEVEKAIIQLQIELSTLLLEKAKKSFNVAQLERTAYEMKESIKEHLNKEGYHYLD